MTAAKDALEALSTSKDWQHYVSAKHVRTVFRALDRLIESEAAPKIVTVDRILTDYGARNEVAEDILSCIADIYPNGVKIVKGEG